MTVLPINEPAPEVDGARPELTLVDDASLPGVSIEFCSCVDANEPDGPHAALEEHARALAKRGMLQTGIGVLVTDAACLADRTEPLPEKLVVVDNPNQVHNPGNRVANTGVFAGIAAELRL